MDSSSFQQPFPVFKRKYIVSLALIFGLLTNGVNSTTEAAKKYYPPGFTPSAEDEEIPEKTETPPVKPEPPVVLVQPSPIVKQIIIKTIPVAEPAKPQDPLDVLIGDHRYYDALRLVDARLKQKPSNTELQLQRAMLLRANDQYDASIEQYASILSKNRVRSIRAAAWNGLGWACYEKGLHNPRIGGSTDPKSIFGAAENAFLQSVQIDSKLSWSWAGLGRVYLLEGRRQEAEKAIQKANQLMPNTLPVQLARADLLLAKRKPTEVLQLLYGLKKSTTIEPDVYLLSARASLDTGKIDDAIINLKQLLDLDANHTNALKLLSRAYELKMRPESAGEALEAAITLNPTDVKSVDELLKIYDRNGDFERGSLLLRTLLKTVPTEVAYVQALLERLIVKDRWKMAYEEGSHFLPPILKISSPDSNTAMPAVSLFAMSASRKGRTVLNHNELLSVPAVQDTLNFTQEHEARIAKRFSAVADDTTSPDPLPIPSQLLQDRYILLSLDPLARLSPLPNNSVIADNDIVTGVKVAFLSGQFAEHKALLNRISTSIAEDKPTTSNQKLPSIISQLYEIGDYAGANTIVKSGLAKQPDAKELQEWQEKLRSTSLELIEQRKALSLLSKKISDAYWEKIAAQMLQKGTGDWQTHALIARILQKKHLPQIAAFHEKMAARFAPPVSEEKTWYYKLHLFKQAHPGHSANLPKKEKR